MSVVANFIRPEDLEALNLQLAKEWEKANPIPANIRVLDIASAPLGALEPEEDEEVFGIGQYILYDPDMPDWALTQIRDALGYEIEGSPATDARMAAVILKERLDADTIEGIYFPQAISSPRYEIVADTFRPGTKYLRMIHTYTVEYSQSSPREQP